MRRTKLAPRHLAAGLAALATVSLIAACGDDGGSVSSDTADTAAPVTAPATTVTVPLGTTPPTGTGGTGGSGGAAFEHPTGADEVVIEAAYEGGFVPVGTDFVGAPLLLVAGDGTAIVSGPQIAIYPGPLLPNFQAGGVDEAQIQALLAQADELGLLADVEYARNDMIADAPDTVVRITADGETYEHRAYALGLDGTETDEARANLQTFVDELNAVVGEVSSQETVAFESDSFLVQARPMTPEDVGDEIEPTVVPWPEDASVRLADAATCAELPWTEGQELFTDANQLTLFDDGGTTYQLSAVPQLPGRSC
jgi:hypothetical protein